MVDTIAPEATITFTSQHVAQVEVDEPDKKPTRQNKESADENTRFIYVGDICATINVKEANFYDDMEIVVYRDGEEFDGAVISPEWTQVGETDQFYKSLTLPADTDGDGTKDGDGDYQIKITYKDKSKNEMNMDAGDEYEGKTAVHEYISNIHTIDTTAPVYTITYDNNDCQKVIGQREYYKKNRTATIKVTDRNFRPNEVVFTVTALDINNNTVETFTYSDLTKLSDWAWEQNGITWTATVPFKVDANYTVNFDYTDIAGHKAVDSEGVRPEEGILYTTLFTVDKVAPKNLNVEYSDLNLVQKWLSNLWFYNADTTVTVSATDATAGIDYFNISVNTDGLAEATDIEMPVDLVVNADGSIRSGTPGFINDIVAQADVDGKVSLTFTVPAQFCGLVNVDSVTDHSNNTSGKDTDDTTIVVDTISPDVKVEFAGSLKDKIDADMENASPTRQTKETADAETRYVYDGKVTATITVKEANFYDDMVVTVYRDGKDVTAVATDVTISDWADGTTADEHIKTVEMLVDGDYRIAITYKDKSHNVMDMDASGEYAEKVQDKMEVYTSNIHTIDTTAPVYTITYDNNTLIQTVGNRDYYAADRIATITVTDRNFRPNEVAFQVVAKDINGAVVEEYAYSALTDTDPWEWSREGDTWTAKVPFDVTANYTVTFDYTDIAGNKAVDGKGKRPEKGVLYTSRFTVDKDDPINLGITYKQPTKLSLIIDMVTFHFYKATATVTISAEEDVAGVDYFDIGIDKEGLDEATTVTLPKDLQVYKNGKVKSGDKGFIKKFTATTTEGVTTIAMELPVQYSGKLTFTAYDYSGNSTAFTTAEAPVAIVDSIAPQVGVEYVAQNENTQVYYVKKGLKKADNFAAATQAYFNGNVTAKITVTEANFFEGVASEQGIIHNVGILLTKTDNKGNVTKTEYLPAGADQMFADETTKTKKITWTSEGQVHTFDIAYEANADYVLTIRYADMSANGAVIKDEGGRAKSEYTSRIITVDKISPVVKVEYSNTNVISTNGDRKYFDDVQTATITITEHNFRADDVKLNVVAQNVFGQAVEVEDFAKQLKTRSNWTHYDLDGNEDENGNVHVATVTFSKDANYTLDIDYTDLATRVSKDYTADQFTVDKTNPAEKKLKVTYDETKWWEKMLESITFGFYNAKMTVTLSADDVTAGIYRFEYSYEPSEGVSDVNKGAKGVREGEDIQWDEKSGTFTAQFQIPKLMLGNDNQFNGTVSFTAYDRAENSSAMDDTDRIVVDNIEPKGTMSFDQPINEANNIRYYTEQFTGTIVITEANFYKEDVQVVISKDDGTTFTPNVTWVDNSVDVHTGTFTVANGDGDYVVTVDYADRSENKMTQIVSQQLTIDGAHPTVSVSNIKNNSANKDEVYGFTITTTDTNNDAGMFKPVLKALVPTENGNYTVKTIDLGAVRTVENGKTYSYTVPNLEEDAVYTLSCTTQDMAKNPYAKIRLEDGKEYDFVTFSVNRDGSTFGVDSTTAKLLEQYYTHNVDSNVVIEEINVDPVEDYTVKLNGTELKEGTDYTTLVDDSPNKWYKRTYVIKKALFENEGEYNIVVESVDKTETTAYSDIKNLKVAFVVDRTAPVLTISGLKENSVYQVEEQVVTIVPADDGGRLHDLKVVLTDSDGKENVLFDMTDDVENAQDSLSQWLVDHNGQIEVTIPQILKGKVSIVCNDYAGTYDAKDTVTVYQQVFDPVTVASNPWVAFYANPWLFYGSIAGVVLLIGGIVFLIVFKKRKKTAAEQ